jgi:hypothetical protein
MFKIAGTLTIYIILNIIMCFYHPFVFMGALIGLGMSVMQEAPSNPNVILYFIFVGTVASLPNLLTMAIGIYYAIYKKKDWKIHLLWGMSFTIIVIIGYIIAILPLLSNGPSPN